MTVKELNRILTANNIPESATLMSNSGWEYGETDMDGVYYNLKYNIVVFTRGFSKKYENDAEWIRVEAKRGGQR